MLRFVWLLCFILISFFLPTIAQEIHSPAEMLKIMEKSKKKYLMNVDSTLTADTLDGLVLQHFFIRTNKDGSKELTTYEDVYGENKEYVEALRQAEEWFSKDDMGKAREYYKKVLEIAPEQSTIMTYIGQTFGQKGQHDSAIVWYLKAITANPLNYMAHWFIADAYLMTKRTDDAYKEILRAHILNRNNPRIMSSMLSILAAKYKSYRKAYFLPAYKLVKENNESLEIKMNMKPVYTMPYAICKALWMFEPGYKEKMLGKKEGVAAMLAEERECVASIVLTEAVKEEDSKEATDDPMVDILLRAFESKMIDVAVMYEVILPRNPRIAAYLSTGTLEDIAQYVEKARLK